MELNNETLREYCLQKPFVSEEFPFDEVTLVFKVGGKMFALLPLDEPEPVISLKCDPERSAHLRDRFNAVRPAYHMNKKHWNMIFVNSDIPTPLVLEMIDHSYELVFNSLPAKIRNQLKSDI